MVLILLLTFGFLFGMSHCSTVHALDAFEPLFDKYPSILTAHNLPSKP